MNQTAILLVCAVLAVAIPLATPHDYFQDQYLDLSLFSKDWELNIEGTKNALINLNVIGCASPADVLAKLEKSHVERSTEHSNQVYKDLIDLYKVNESLDNDVMFRVVNRMMEICKILNDFTFDGEKEIAAYLSKIGIVWLTKRYIEVLNNLRQGNPDQHESLMKFDMLFLNFFNLKKCTEMFLVNILSDLDLTRDTFDVINGAKAALDLENWNEEEKKRPLHIIYTFMNRMCDQIRSGREVYINSLVLIFTLRPSGQRILKIAEKLREYNRICASLRREKSRVFWNLARQINWMDWPNQAVLDLDLLIAAFLGLETPNDDVMLRILTTLDLTTCDLNVNKAIEVALNLEIWHEAEKEDPLSTVTAIILKMCDQLQFGSEFKIYQATLEGKSDYHKENLPIEVKKWMEYNHFCKNLRGRELMIYNNLVRQANLYTQESVEPTTIDFLSKFE